MSSQPLPTSIPAGRFWDRGSSPTSTAVRLVQTAAIKRSANGEAKRFIVKKLPKVSPIPKAQQYCKCTVSDLTASQRTQPRRWKLPGAWILIVLAAAGEMAQG